MQKKFLALDIEILQSRHAGSTELIFHELDLYNTNGPRQANLVLIAYASSEGSGELD